MGADGSFAPHKPLRQDQTAPFAPGLHDSLRRGEALREALDELYALQDRTRLRRLEMMSRPVSAASAASSRASSARPSSRPSTRGGSKSPRDPLTGLAMVRGEFNVRVTVLDIDQLRPRLRGSASRPLMEARHYSLPEGAARVPLHRLYRGKK